MIILGIETSCDETAVAILRDGRHILANVISSQIALHQQYGGVVPELASREHIVNIIPVLDAALEQARLTWDAIDAIAVTRGPGLAGALLVGVNTGKALAFALGKPFVGVNHLEGHIYSNWVVPEGGPRPFAERLGLVAPASGGPPPAPPAAPAADELPWQGRRVGYGPAAPPTPPVPATLSTLPPSVLPLAIPNPQSEVPDFLRLDREPTDPVFPLICLVVSGGHTELLHMTGHGTYQMLGRTVDDAAGEAFDKVARILGLGYPGGPAIQRAAAAGNPAAFDFPRSTLRGTFDFSFSGLKTAVLRKVGEFGPPLPAAPPPPPEPAPAPAAPPSGAPAVPVVRTLGRPVTPSPAVPSSPTASTPATPVRPSMARPPVAAAEDDEDLDEDLEDEELDDEELDDEEDGDADLDEGVGDEDAEKAEAAAPAPPVPAPASPPARPATPGRTTPSTPASTPRGTDPRRAPAPTPSTRPQPPTPARTQPPTPNPQPPTPARRPPSGPGLIRVESERPPAQEVPAPVAPPPPEPIPQGPVRSEPRILGEGNNAAPPAPEGDVPTFLRRGAPPSSPTPLRPNQRPGTPQVPAFLRDRPASPTDAPLDQDEDAADAPVTPPRRAAAPPSTSGARPTGSNPTPPRQPPPPLRPTAPGVRPTGSNAPPPRPAPPVPRAPQPPDEDDEDEVRTPSARPPLSRPASPANPPGTVRPPPPPPRPLAEREIRPIPKAAQAGRPTRDEDSVVDAEEADISLDDEPRPAPRVRPADFWSELTDDDVTGAGDDDPPPARPARPLALESTPRPTASVRVPGGKPEDGPPKPPLPVADVAAAFQAAAVEMLVEKTVQAAATYRARTVLVAGGVAANALLRARLQERLGPDITLRAPPLILCTDNAAMIAATAYFRYAAGLQTDWTLDIDPNDRYWE